MPDDVLVLPSHNQPFRGLHRRIGALRDSQHRALDRLRLALRQPQRVVDVYGALFSRPVAADNMQMSLATGESVAHINYLVARGEARASIGDDGCAWYQMN